jgi:hypothetical protein
MEQEKRPRKLYTIWILSPSVPAAVYDYDAIGRNCHWQWGGELTLTRILDPLFTGLILAGIGAVACFLSDKRITLRGRPPRHRWFASGTAKALRTVLWVGVSYGAAIALLTYDQWSAWVWNRTLVYLAPPI